MPQTTENLKTNDLGVFALIKGPSGAGKSDLSLSFPNPYILDHDRKMPSIAMKHFPGKIFHWDTFSDVFQINEKLNEFSKPIPREHPTEEEILEWNNACCPYETLIGDSITQLSYTALKTIDDVKGQNVFSHLRNVKKTKSGTQQIELRGFDYYNGEDSFLKYYIDTLKELWARPGNPKHVLLIAHILESESQDMKTKVVTRTRRIVTAGQKIAAYIPSQFDEEWLVGVEPPALGDEKGNSKRIAIFQPNGEDFAKTAFNLPNEIDFTNKNFFEIFQREVRPKEKTL